MPRNESSGSAQELALRRRVASVHRASEMGCSRIPDFRQILFSESGLPCTPRICNVIFVALSCLSGYHVLIHDKGKPVARRGRKAYGPPPIGGGGRVTERSDSYPLPTLIVASSKFNAKNGVEMSLIPLSLSIESESPYEHLYSSPKGYI